MPSTRRRLLQTVPVALFAPLCGCMAFGSNPPPGALHVLNEDDRAHEVTATVLDGPDEGSSVMLSVGAGGSSTSEQFVGNPEGETVSVVVDGNATETVELIPGGNVEVRIDPDESFSLTSAHYD